MVEHVNILDADRHEPKGASTAGLNQVLHSDGDGTTTWKSVDYDNLANKPVPQGYTLVLTGASGAASQAPVAVNTPIQIEYGPLQVTTDATLAADGLLTFNTAGQYAVTLFSRFGRTTAAGSAILFNRILRNGVQTLNSNSITMVDDAAVIPFSATILMDVAAGDTFSQEIYRDSVGVNNGGLFLTTPTLAGWLNSPSATIVVSKYRGEAP